MLPLGSQLGLLDLVGILVLKVVDDSFCVALDINRILDLGQLRLQISLVLIHGAHAPDGGVEGRSKLSKGWRCWCPNEARRYGSPGTISISETHDYLLSL